MSGWRVCDGSEPYAAPDVPDGPTDDGWDDDEPPTDMADSCANGDLCDWLTTTMGAPEMLNDWDLCKGCEYYETRRKRWR